MPVESEHLLDSAVKAQDENVLVPTSVPLLVLDQSNIEPLEMQE